MKSLIQSNAWYFGLLNNHANQRNSRPISIVSEQNVFAKRCSNDTVF